MPDEPEWYGEAPTVSLVRLFELAIDENTPVGLNWEYKDEFAGRASHFPHGDELKFSFSPPSQHEHLEAHLQLREWLQARVSPEELSELLGRVL